MANIKLAGKDGPLDWLALNWIKGFNSLEQLLNYIHTHNVEGYPKYQLIAVNLDTDETFDLNKDDRGVYQLTQPVPYHGAYNEMTRYKLVKSLAGEHNPIVVGSFGTPSSASAYIEAFPMEFEASNPVLIDLKENVGYICSEVEGDLTPTPPAKWVKFGTIDGTLDKKWKEKLNAIR